MNDIVNLVNALFGSDVLPRSEYLFRKLWADKTQMLVTYHYYCSSRNDLMSVGDSEGELVCPTCKKASRSQFMKRDGFFFRFTEHDILA